MQKSIHELLEKLIKKVELSAADISMLFEAILNQEICPEQISAALVLLRAKGESYQEIAVAAESILERAAHIKGPPKLFGDIVGTGGDGLQSINVSTLASLTVATEGFLVAKHGSVSVSSKCGSADLLRELGLSFPSDGASAIRQLERFSWTFLFAPHFHLSFQAVRELRKNLAIRTIFNVLGPLVNPMRPPIMLIGVYSPTLIMPFAHALKAMKKKRVLVVHGSGLDEIALHGPTECALLDDGTISQFSLKPEELGLKTCALENIKGADPKRNAELSLDILRGQGPEAHQHIVAASAGALLWLGEKAKSPYEGVDMALASLQAQKPYRLIKALVEDKGA
jgi:anthranilate phosphoribosyltransferase